MMSLAKLLLLHACIVPLACSSLPEYAAPKGRVIDPEEYDASDVIPYRSLVRDDFKGTQAPAAFAPYADRLGAATCAYILTTPGTQLAIRQARSRDGTTGYEATPRRLGFHAQMDRACSWWNASQEELPTAYVLEHEQIHFALFELGARRLNAAAAGIAGRVLGTAATPEGAAEEAERWLEEQIQQELYRTLERSREFDEDTSFGYEPGRQKAWRARVDVELRASAE